MITVIIEGTSGIENTVKSLVGNAKEGFRLFVDESWRQGLAELYKEANVEFVRPGKINRYGKSSDLYWQIPSGCLILVASWDLRLGKCIKETKKMYCVSPSGQRYYATNFQRNVGKWKGDKYIVPILRVTET